MGLRARLEPICNRRKLFQIWSLPALPLSFRIPSVDVLHFAHRYGHQEQHNQGFRWIQRRTGRVQ